MQGEYIGASVEGGKICAPILRKKVKLTQGETSFLHVNTLGYHEIYINGRKVGEDVLTPAVSHLSKFRDNLTCLHARKKSPLESVSLFCEE